MNQLPHIHPRELMTTEATSITAAEQADAIRALERLGRYATVAFEPLAVYLDRVPDLTGLTRTQVYELVKSGQLRTFKVGRRRLATTQAIRDLLARLDGGIDSAHTV